MFYNQGQKDGPKEWKTKETGEKSEGCLSSFEINH